MVMKPTIMKLIAAALAVVPASGVLAQNAPQDPSAPDPIAWMERMNFPAGSPLLRRVVALRSFPSDRGELALPNIDRSGLAATNFLDFATLEDIGWTDSINRRSSWAGRGVGRRVKSLLQATGSQAVLILPAAGSADAMALVRPGDNNNLDTLAHKTDHLPNAADPREVGVALRQMLGFDAIALSHEGPYVLAQTPDLNIAVKLLHAVAIGNSAGKFTVSRDTGDPVAFLRLARASGHYSVWRVVSSTSGGTIPAGTKLLLESRARPSLKAAPQATSPAETTPQ